jgi:putative aldouronate transport system substrate-binding protein
MRAADQPLSVSRRDFLRLSAAFGAGGVPLVLQACAPSAPSATTSARTATTSALKLPTYAPFTGVRAELPATPDGVPAGYLSFPQSPVKSVSQPPGKEGEVSIMGWTVQAPPPPLEQNPAWQELKRILK